MATFSLEEAYGDPAPQKKTRTFSLEEAYAGTEVNAEEANAKRVPATAIREPTYAPSISDRLVAGATLETKPEVESVAKGVTRGAINLSMFPLTVTQLLGQAAGIPREWRPWSGEDVQNMLGLYPAQQSVTETPRDVSDRYLERGSEFSVGPGSKLGFGMGLASELGGDVAGPTGALLSAMSVPILSKGKDMAVRGAMRGPSAAPMQQNIDTLFRAGIKEPTVGVAAQRFAPQAAETTISRIPGGAGRMVGKGKEFAAGMENRVEDIASTLSPAREFSQAGRSIQTGIESFADNLKSRFQTLNAPVDGALTGKVLPVSNFQKALGQSGTPILGAEDLSLALGAREGKLVTANEALNTALLQNQGGLPYEAIRQLRSAIGEKLSNPQLIDDISRRTYSKLYGALSEDIRAAAQPAGVIKDFENANKVFSSGVGRIESMLKQIGSKSSYEEAYQSAMSGTKHGPSKIWALKRSIGDEDFKSFQAVVINDLGKAKGAAGSELERGFSSETFLTNYRNMNVKARDALFGASTPLRKDLDTVAEAAGMLRESGKAFANPSGTGQAIGALAVGTSIPTALAFMGTGNVAVGLSLIGGALGTSLGAQQAAKLMTNPRFVHWLAASTKMPVKELAAHASRLNAAATMERDPEMKQSMQTLAQELSGPRRIYSQEEPMTQER